MPSGQNVSTTTATGAHLGAVPEVAHIGHIVPGFLRAVDGRDWSAVDQMLSSDFSYTQGSPERALSRSDFIARQQRAALRLSVGRHFSSNNQILREEMEAVHKCYVMKHRFHRSAHGGEIYFSGAAMVFGLVQEAGVWRIRSLDEAVHFSLGADELAEDRAPAKFPEDGSTSLESHRVYPLSMRGPDEKQVEGLVVDFMRNADENRTSLMEGTLSSKPTASPLGVDQVLRGPASIVDGFAAPARGLRRYLSNPVVMVKGDESTFGFYVYNVEAEDSSGSPVRQYGGILTGRCVREDGRWRIEHLEITATWDDDVPMSAEIAAGLLDADHAERVWKLDGHRDLRSDEDELKLLMIKYTWYYDHADHRMNEVFADDVESSYSTDTNDVHTGREELLARLQRTRRTVHRFTQHYLGTIVTSIHQDRDYAEVSGYVFTRRAPPGSEVTLSAAGRYDALARKVDGRWRFFAYHYVRAYPAWDRLE